MTTTIARLTDAVKVPGRRELLRPGMFGRVVGQHDTHVTIAFGRGIGNTRVSPKQCEIVEYDSVDELLEDLTA